MSIKESSVKFKTKSCKNYLGQQTDLNREISMYIVLTRKCNTNCKFCEYHSGKSEIDLAKLEKAIVELREICNITTVHFTGGEPTLELEKLKQICKMIKQQSKLIQTSVNTNGTRLKELENIEELDNIALSRHNITDEENREIFRSNLVASIDDIKNFKEKQKIHLSCNLIKGYVDTAEKIKEYLELAANLGIKDTGFVSLMGINDFAKDNFVNFESLEVDKISNITKNRCFTNISETTGEVCCRCENYLYRASNMNFVSMYHRYAIKNNEIADYIVYEDNILKQGFNGNIIKSYKE